MSDRSLTREAVLAIAEAAERLSCYLVVDEAFIDFAPEHSVVREAARYSHLIVLRSLTKYYALSGLRIGYGVFPLSMGGLMHDHKEPWTVNSLAQKAIGSLRKKGILIRGCSNFPGLDESYVRVAVRSLEENSALLKELAVPCAL